MKPNPRGYTLIEILVALFIFAIVAALSATALRQALSVKTRMRVHAGELSKLQASIQILLRDGFSIIHRPSQSKTDPSLMGAEDNVTFIRYHRRIYDSADPRSQLQRAGYSLDDHKIYRIAYPYVDAKDEMNFRRQVLFDHVDKMTISYYSKERGWVSRWPLEEEQTTNNEKEETEKLPCAMQMTIFFKDEPSPLTILIPLIAEQSYVLYKVAS